MLIGIGMSLMAGLKSSASPAALFASAEPGVWYDPSDLTTLFQDNAGATPVTTPGQTVGLMLDKSQGLVLGSELVTNGTFDSGTTGWVIGNVSWNASSGVMLNDGSNVGVAANFQQYSVVTSGRTYRVTFDFSRTSGSLNLWLAGSQLVKSGINTSGTKTFTVLASVTGSIFFEAAASSVVSIDNISVKLLSGNHATQSTSAQRPTYGINPIVGTRNLLTYTERFDNAVWTKSQATVSANTAVAPDGTATADTLVESSANDFHTINQPVGTIGATETYSFYAKAAGRSWLVAQIGGGANAYFDVTNGVLGNVSSGTASISSVGNGWYRCVFTAVRSGNANNIIILASANGTPSYLGNGTSGVYLWGAQLELGSTATAYQKVVSQYEVTQAGVQSAGYLRFDGVDDGMVTNTITPNIDKVQVFAGVRKLSDASQAIVAEMSVQASSNAGVFLLTAPNGAAANYNFASKGTTLVNNIVTTYTSPITSVISGLGNISGPSSLVRVNGSQVGSVLSSQGTGNYLAYPLYIGRRGGASNPFNGRIYSLIVRFGANLTTGQITATESWVNGETGAY